MSVTSGFFNSVNGDRKYDAEQMSQLFDGLISDGVFATYGEAFAVTPGNGLQVVVASGRAWFDHVWVLNDGPLMIDIPENTFDRGFTCYGIVIDVDRRSDVRSASIVRVGSPNYVIEGSSYTASDLPVYLDVVSDNERKQYLIACIVVKPGDTTISAENIHYFVGRKSTYSYCPNFVTGVVSMISTDVFISRIEALHAAKLASKVDEFNAWFTDLKETIGSNTAVNLTSRILNLEGAVAQYPTSAQMHRNIFRGQYLGNSVTALQLASIADGSFDDIYVGDYWTIEGVNWVVADFDYWFNMGDTVDTKLTKHHLIIVPEKRLYTSSMHGTDYTMGGYIKSNMYIAGLTQAKNIINNAFGNSVITHRNYLTNSASSSGYALSGAWYDSAIELMNELMVYGTTIYTNAGSYTTSALWDTIDKIQLSLFRLAPTYIHADGSYWLRDIAYDGRFCCVQHTGLATFSTATTNIGVRPVFAIG